VGKVVVKRSVQAGVTALAAWTGPAAPFIGWAAAEEIGEVTDAIIDDPVAAMKAADDGIKKANDAVVGGFIQGALDTQTERDRKQGLYDGPLLTREETIELESMGGDGDILMGR
jgi:hypothetical protein